MNENFSINCNLPIYEQIKQQILFRIFTGELKSGDQLPSIRSLAKQLSVSVITTKRAYDDLEKDEFLVTKHGLGSYVRELDKELLTDKKKKIIQQEAKKLVNLCELYSFNKDDLIKIINSFDWLTKVIMIWFLVYLY